MSGFFSVCTVYWLGYRIFDACVIVFERLDTNKTHVGLANSFWLESSLFFQCSMLGWNANVYIRARMVKWENGFFLLNSSKQQSCWQCFIVLFRNSCYFSSIHSLFAVYFYFFWSYSSASHQILITFKHELIVIYCQQMSNIMSIVCEQSNRHIMAGSCCVSVNYTWHLWLCALLYSPFGLN